ncbi:hypothetical protein STEG23_014447 [Scotinomys teguina]
MPSLLHSSNQDTTQTGPGQNKKATADDGRVHGDAQVGFVTLAFLAGIKEMVGPESPNTCLKNLGGCSRGSENDRIVSPHCCLSHNQESVDIAASPQDLGSLKPNGGMDGLMDGWMDEWVNFYQVEMEPPPPAGDSRALGANNAYAFHVTSPGHAKPPQASTSSQRPEWKHAGLGLKPEAQRQRSGQGGGAAAATQNASCWQ